MLGTTLSEFGYGTYCGTIALAKGIYAPVSNFAGCLGFARSTEGLMRAFNQLGDIASGEGYDTAAKVCRVVGAPEKILADLKNTLSWFVLYARVSRLPDLGKEGWQKGVATIALLAQNILETCFLLPMRWGFKTAWHQKELKLAKDIISGIANVFNAIAAHKEIKILEEKLKAPTALSQQEINRLETDLDWMQKTIVAHKSIAPHLYIQMHDQAVQKKWDQRVQAASGIAQKLFLGAISALFTIKMQARQGYYAKRPVEAEKEAGQIYTKQLEEAESIQEVLAKNAILSIGENNKITRYYQAHEAKCQGARAHNLRFERENALCARDFNIAKCFMIPVTLCAFFGIESTPLKVYAFLAGLTITYLGFRRSFCMLNHHPKPLPPLANSGLFLKSKVS